MKKRINGIWVCCLLLGMIIIGGCSSETGNNFQRRGGNPDNFPGDRQFQFNRSMNLTDEERQQMMEEIQQKAIEACKEKSKGDSCKIENPREEIEGICKIIEENLVCTTDRPMRQRVE